MAATVVAGAARATPACYGDGGMGVKMAILATRDFMGNSLGFNGGNEDLMGFNGV